MTAERRGGRRVAAVLPAVLVVLGDVPLRLDARTEDLSRGGCRLRVDGQVPPASRGVLAVRHGSRVCTRPVGEAWPAGEGVVRVSFAPTRDGGDDWDDLLQALGGG